MPPEKQPVETKDDQFTLEIIDDTQEQVDLFDDAPAAKPDKQSRKKADKKADSGDDAVALMKRQLDEANARIKTEADARAAESTKRAEIERELADARKRGEEAEGLSIVNAKSAAQAEADRIEADLAKAWEDGEYKKASELQRKLARAEAILLRLDGEEADHKERKASAPEPEKKTETPAAPKAPANLEEWLATVQLPERAKGFFRDHPEFAPINKNKAKYYMLNAAHEEALADGINFDTGDYYNFLNKRLIDDDEEDDDVDEPDRDDGRVPPAPVSRSSPPSSGGQRGTPVRATRAEVEMAEIFGMSVKEYKEYQAKAKANGDIQ